MVTPNQGASNARSVSLNAWLHAQLNAIGRERPRARQRDLTELAGSLRQLHMFASAPLAVSVRADPNVTARHILRGGAYRVKAAVAERPSKSWWQRFKDWLAARLEKLFGRVGKAMGSSTIVQVAVLIALVIAMIFGIWRVRAALGRRVRRSQGVRSALYADETPLDELPRSSALLALAQHTALALQYAHAVAYLFQSACLALSEHAVVPYDPSRTVREYRSAVRRHGSALSAPFDSMASIFTSVAFSPRDAERSDWQAMSEANAALRSALAAAVSVTTGRAA
jgi:hypothetical protein